MKVAAAFVIALCTSAVLGVPLHPQEGHGLLSDNDDEATVNAEIEQAIGRDVSMHDVGESQSISSSDPWEKKTMDAIASMSNSEVKSASVVPTDKITAQMEADAKQAKAVIAGPAKMKEAEKASDKMASAALKSPKRAAELRKYAAEAELEMETQTLPVTFIDESSPASEDVDDIGEDDLGASNLKLMDGSDADVMKQINAQIGVQVSKQIGSIPVNAMDTSTMKKLAEDKAEASKFLEAQAKPAADPAAKVDAELASVQAFMKSAEDADKDADADEDDEGDEADEE